MNYFEWWESLSFLQSFYWIIAVSSTVLFVILLILTLTGGDGHSLDNDFDSDSDISQASFHVFSLRSILAFLMVFAWSGIVALESGKLNLMVILIISFFAGLAMMLLTAWSLFLLSKLEQKGNLDVENAVGENGEVYLSIPAERKGVGKIQIIVQNQLQTLDALTDEHNSIKTGCIVTVIAVEPDKSLLVITKSDE